MDQSSSKSKIGKFVTFKIADYWFALPMTAVLKIVNCPPPDQGGIVPMGVVQLSSHTIQLLDLYRTFSLGPNAISSNSASFLLVLRSAHSKLWGIALHTPPDLIQLPLTAFKSVSLDKRFAPQPSWISHIAIIADHDFKQTLLFLNLKTVFQPKAMAI